jgi:hypothetical protein
MGTSSLAKTHDVPSRRLHQAKLDMGHCRCTHPSCGGEKSDDDFEHALVFFYGYSVPAAFLAEHAPCREVCNGVRQRPEFCLKRC